MKKTFFSAAMVFLALSVSAFNRNDFHDWYTLSQQTANPKEKIAYLLRSLQCSPANTEIFSNRVYIQLGELFEQLGMTTAAQQMYRNSIAVTEGNTVPPPMTFTSSVPGSSPDTAEGSVHHPVLAGKSAEFKFYYKYSLTAVNPSIKIACLLQCLNLSPREYDLYIKTAALLEKKKDIRKAWECREIAIDVLLDKNITPPELGSYAELLPPADFIRPVAYKPLEQLFYEKARQAEEFVQKKLYLMKSLQANPDFTPARKMLQRMNR